MSFGVHFDLSIPSAEETKFINRHTGYTRKIAQEYRLPIEEIIGLSLIYYKFQCANQQKKRGMLKTQLREFLHNTLDMTDYDLTEFVSSSLDIPRNPTKYFSLDRWIRSMLLFLHGSVKDKIAHCFKVYDRFNAGMLTRNNMALLLKKSLIMDELDLDDSLRELVDILMKRLDFDKDGVISREDYMNYVLKDPLGMETFGQCLPNRNAIRNFYQVFLLKWTM